MRACKFCRAALPERVGLSPRHCWPLCEEGRRATRGGRPGLKAVSDKKMARIEAAAREKGYEPGSKLTEGGRELMKFLKDDRPGVTAFVPRSPLLGKGPQAMRSKAEWALEKEWGLRVTAFWQRQERMREDVCFCALCGQYHPWEDSTIDHIKEREGAPELKHEPNNFQPAGKECNKKKHQARVLGSGYERWAGDKRPETLQLVFLLFRASDWEAGGRRLRIKAEEEWAVEKR